MRPPFAEVLSAERLQNTQIQPRFFSFAVDIKRPVMEFQTMLIIIMAIEWAVCCAPNVAVRIPCYFLRSCRHRPCQHWHPPTQYGCTGFWADSVDKWSMLIHPNSSAGVISFELFCSPYRKMAPFLRTTQRGTNSARRQGVQLYFEY